MLGVDGLGGAWITNPKISQGKSAADAIKFSPAYIIDRTGPRSQAPSIPNRQQLYFSCSPLMNMNTYSTDCYITRTIILTQWGRLEESVWRDQIFLEESGGKKRPTPPSGRVANIRNKKKQKTRRPLVDVQHPLSWVAILHFLKLLIWDVCTGVVVGGGEDAKMSAHTHTQTSFSPARKTPFYLFPLRAVSC